MVGHKRLATLIAGIFISCQSFGQPPISNPTPDPAVTQRLPVSPAPFGSAAPPPSPPPGSPGYVPPPLASDTRDEFSYSPSSEYEGFSTVYPTGGGEPINVSTTFLNLTLKSGGTDAEVLQSARNYEKMNASISDKFMDQFFPDSTADSASLQPRAIQGTDQDIVVEQDPLAGPYARVTVSDKEGNVISESSVSAQAAAGILDQPYLSADQQIAALARPDFLLPESARQNFSSMSAEQLRALVLEKPELANQEFIKAAKVIAAENEKKAGQEAARSTSLAGEATTDTPDSPVGFVSTVDEPELVAPDYATTIAIAYEGADVQPLADDDPQHDSYFNTSPGQSNLPLIGGITIGIIALGIFLYGIYRIRR